MVIQTKQFVCVVLKVSKEIDTMAFVSLLHLTIGHQVVTRQITSSTRQGNQKSAGVHSGWGFGRICTSRARRNW